MIKIIYNNEDELESIFRNHILRHWETDRITKFAKHLLGDKCQQCKKQLKTKNPNLVVKKAKKSTHPSK
jgi:hypothetical protein